MLVHWSNQQNHCSTSNCTFISLFILTFLLVAVVLTFNTTSRSSVQPSTLSTDQRAVHASLTCISSNRHYHSDRRSCRYQVVWSNLIPVSILCWYMYSNTRARLIEGSSRVLPVVLHKTRYFPIPNNKNIIILHCSILGEIPGSLCCYICCVCDLKKTRWNFGPKSRAVNKYT